MMSPAGFFQPGFFVCEHFVAKMKLRSHLIALVVAAVLPVLLFAAVMIYFSYQQQRATIERGMIDTARALSLAVDRELDASIRTLQALATSEHLTSGDLGKFYRFAQVAIKGVRGWEGIALIDPSGQQILNLRRPFGTKLPRTATPYVIKEVTETRAPIVSDIFQGGISQSPLVLVGVPVIRDGQLQYVLEASISPGFLVMLLSQQKIPADWTGTVIDRKKIIIARTRELERFMGQPADRQFVSKSAGAEEGWFRNVSNEGMPVYAAFSRSQLSGWTVALGIPAAAVEAPLRRTLILTGIGGFLLLGVGVLLASIVGYRIARAVERLSVSARALGAGETLKLEASPIVELDQVAREIELAAVNRQLAEQQLRELLIRDEALIQASAEIIYDWRPPTNELKWEGDFGRILGYTSAEIGTNTASWTSRVHPDDLDRVLREVEDCTSQRRLYDLEYRFRRSDGNYVWMHDRGLPFITPEGHLERVLGLFRDITQRKHAEDELRTSREQLRALARYLQSVREEEKTRIARELHDEIGQALTAIKLSLETNMREPVGHASPSLGPALELTNELIGRVRNLSLELRPAMLDDLGLLAALRWHFDRYTTQMKIKVDFKHTGLEGRRFAPDIETAAYRIVQEALTNVARHAGVDKVEVEIQADEGALRIRIKDQGIGFAPDSLTAGTTGGLSGMRERAIMFGGQLEIESAPGTGTILTAELPLKNR